MGAVWGWCRGGEGVGCFDLGVTATVIDLKWVTHALCSDLTKQPQKGFK